MHETAPCDHEPIDEEFDFTWPDLEPQERVSFIRRSDEVAPNYDHLCQIAQNADSGAVILTETLVQLGHLEPLQVLANRQHNYNEATKRREELIVKRATKGQTLSDDESTLLTVLAEVLLEHGPSLQLWHNADIRINKAQDYYRQVFVNRGEDGQNMIDRDHLEALYDDTAEYDNSTLLTTLRTLRSRLPRPRTEVRGRPQPNIVENNVAEAERIARLLILEELGQISFDRQ